MANLKEIRVRIASVNSTKQITSAMKVVSAAKLKKAQDNIVMLRPYVNKLQDILATLSANGGNSNNPYSKDRHPEKVLVVVVTSNRGFCGAFNSNVIKLALYLTAEKYERQFDNRRVTFLPIGRKAFDFFVKKNYQVVEGNYNDLLDNPDFAKTAPVAEKIIEAFLDGTFDRVELVYNQFKNAAVQDTVAEQFLPIPKNDKKPAKGKKAVHYDFIYEPSEESIIKELIPKSLKAQLHKAIVDSVASEHGARMTAMHKATDNATELAKQLTLQYNKARQTSITNEILEIVSGANALKG
ncbi:MAG: ATP synthase F1 subunit gamma [Bacteroidota bacterium]|nr:ATP synthase F1 subunit gamma [Bacteroidota bacterium]